MCVIKFSDTLRYTNPVKTMNRHFAGLLTFIVFFYTSGEAFAQLSFLNKRWQESKIPERGMVILVGGGISAVRSDICAGWGCNNFGPNASVGALYKFNPYLSAGVNADYVRLGATEKDPTHPLNVAFQSEVIALTGNVMYNLLDSYAGSGNYRSLRKRFVVPYVRAGAGAVYYTATSFPAQNDLLESQSTYDPETKYPAVSLVFPFGGGLRFRFSDEIAVAPELIYHITTSDFLDNVGPRLGNPDTKDHYGLFTIKVMYTPLIKNNIFSRKKAD